jgi:hypothetical protein
VITERQNNIIAAAVMILIPMVYFIGAYQWKVKQFSSIPAEVAHGKEIYFVCFSSALYAAASVCFLLSKVWWLKLISSSVSSVCAVILYEEIRYGDRQWTQWSYWLIVVFTLNYFIFYCLIERYKKEIKYGG